MFTRTLDTTNPCAVGSSLGTYTCPSGIFPLVYILTPFFLRINNFSCLAPWIWCLNRLTGCPPGAGENVSHTMDLVCQVYVLTSSDDSRVDGIMCAGRQ